MSANGPHSKQHKLRISQSLCRFHVRNPNATSEKWTDDRRKEHSSIMRKHWREGIYDSGAKASGRRANRALIKKLEVDSAFRNRMSRTSSRTLKRLRMDPEFVRAWRRSQGRIVSGPQMSLFKSLCRRGFRGIRLEHPVPPYSIDMAFPEKRIAVEVDGIYWHSSKKQKRLSLRRDRYLKSRGWTIFHVIAEKWKASKIWRLL